MTKTKKIHYSKNFDLQKFKFDKKSSLTKIQV